MSEDYQEEPQPQDAPELRTGPDWEEHGYSPATFFSTTWKILFSPWQTFSRMRIEGGLLPPMLFLLGWGLIQSMLGYLFLKWVVEPHLVPYFVAHFQQEWQQLSEFVANSGRDALPALTADALIDKSTPAQQLLNVVLSPFTTVCFVMIASGVTHWILVLFKSAKYPFEATFRGLAYLSGMLMMIACIPVIGMVLANIVNLIYSVIFLACIHEANIWRIVGYTVLLPLLLLFCCCALLPGF